MNKKLLIISGAINYGAPGKIVEQTGLLAEKYGYEVLVAHSSRNENPSQLHHFSITTKWEERKHALGAKLFDLHGLFSDKATKELIDKIKDFAPDVIQLHNIHGYFLNFRILFEYLRTVSIPVVWTLHDCWAFTGRCFHFENIGCEKWKVGCHDCEAETGYTVSPFCDRSTYLFELKKKLFASVPNLTIVPVSHWLESYARESFLQKHQMVVIQNGIDLNIFKPTDGTNLRTKLGLKDKFVILGVAAPFNKRKGLEDFIKLRTLLDNEYSIVLIGLTHNQTTNLPKGIIGLSRTESQKELAQYYSMANVFCNLTYQDTFPTVNIESLSCGTPVVTYNTGGSPEIIDEMTGVVVEKGNILELAKTLKEIKLNPYLTMENCRKRAEQNFNKDIQFGKYIDLYESILSK